MSLKAAWRSWLQGFVAGGGYLTVGELMVLRQRAAGLKLRRRKSDASSRNSGGPSVARLGRLQRLKDKGLFDLPREKQTRAIADRAPWTIGTCAFAISLFGLGDNHAHAQSAFLRDDSADVASRPHPDYAALGIKWGAFTISPVVTLTGSYDDNIYGVAAKTGDFITKIHPVISAASDWDRNQLSIKVDGEYDAYASHGSENSDEFSALASGRIDLDHDSAINLSIEEALMTESRTAEDNLSSFEHPVQYNVTEGDGSIYREFNHIRVTFSTNAAKYDYSNVALSTGGTFDEETRNELAVSEALRVDYAVSPEISLFVQTSQNQNIFDDQPPKVPLDLNSTGYTVTGGTNFQITHFLTGEAGFGILDEKYSNSAFGEIQGFSYDVTLKYYPTELLTLGLKANHKILPSGIAQSPGTDAEEAELTADYELLRNCVISGHADYTQYTYPGLDRQDDRVDLGAQAKYLVNRSLFFTLSYGHLSQDSSGAGHGQTFDDDRVTLSLSLQR